MMDVAMLGIMPIVGSLPGQAAQFVDPSCSFEAVMTQLLGQPDLGTESKVEMGSVRAGRQEIEKNPDMSGQSPELQAAIATAVLPSQDLPRFVEKTETEQAASTTERADRPLVVRSDWSDMSDVSDLPDLPRLVSPEQPPPIEPPTGDRPVSRLPGPTSPPEKTASEPQEFLETTELIKPKSDESDMSDSSDVSDVSEMAPAQQRVPQAKPETADVQQPIPVPQRVKATVEASTQPVFVEASANQSRPQPVPVQTDAIPPAAVQPLVVAAENEIVVTAEDQPLVDVPKVRLGRRASLPTPVVAVDRQPIGLLEVRGQAPAQPVEIEPAEVMDIRLLPRLEEGSQSDQPVRTEPKPDWMPIESPSLPGWQAVKVEGQTNAHLPPEEVIQAKIVHQIVRSVKLHPFDGGGSMVLRLDPPHLGMIRMDVTADNGVVTANLSTSTESVKQLLEADLPALNQSLADAGVRVDAISVQTNLRLPTSVADNWSQGPNWQGSSQHAGGQNGNQQYPRTLQMQGEPSSEAESRRMGQFDYMA